MLGQVGDEPLKRMAAIAWYISFDFRVPKNTLFLLWLPTFSTSPLLRRE